MKLYMVILVIWLGLFMPTSQTVLEEASAKEAVLQSAKELKAFAQAQAEQRRKNKGPAPGSDGNLPASPVNNIPRPRSRPRRGIHEKLQQQKEKENQIRKIREEVRLEREKTDLERRRRLEEGTSAIKPTCVDGEKNGDEVSIDCGGSCRTETYMKHGLEFFHLCGHAEDCNVDDDCLSNDCDEQTFKCNPRKALFARSDKDLLRNMYDAFFDVVSQYGDDPRLRTTDIQSFIMATLNPDTQELSSALQTTINERILQFKKSEGLLDGFSQHRIRLGFITKGKAFNFVKSLLELQENSLREL